MLEDTLNAIKGLLGLILLCVFVLPALFSCSF
jgi:hypothetical protein